MNPHNISVNDNLNDGANEEYNVSYNNLPFQLSLKSLAKV